MNMKKICFIVQRYGLEVNGGAELECRQFAEHLVERYDVSVLTSKAIDYITWENEYIADEEVINSVFVKRFPVLYPRNINAFNAINADFLAGKIATLEQERDWIDKQGPYMPELIQYLRNHHDNYDVFIFSTYLYYPTVIGINEVADKAIVIPNAHDEPFLRMKIFRNVFTKPRALFYNTVEERELINKKFFNTDVKSDIGGVGVEIPDDVNPHRFKEKYHLERYIIYVGRIDAGKKCDVLFNYFSYYKKRNENEIKLVLMGKNVIPVPKHKDICNLGFVSDQDKFDGIAGAELLILPSEFESLSMVVLEALALKVPVVVNGVCEVLKGHCVKSNAGLYYKNYFEFEGCINYILEHKREREVMGENGKLYVNKNYQWDVIMDKLSNLIDFVCSPIANL